MDSIFAYIDNRIIRSNEFGDKFARSVIDHAL